MFSRIFVRTVLITIISAMVWALYWTWVVAEAQNLAQRVFLSIIEGSVLLAALSLLIESFLSFTSLEVKRGSYSYYLFGLHVLDEDRRISSINAKTCDMFGIRSFILSLVGVVTAAVMTVLFQALKGAVSFLFDPYLPSVDWLAVGKFAGFSVAAFIAAILFLRGIDWLSDKLTNTTTAVKITVWTLTISVLFSLTISVIAIFNPIDSSPPYVIFLTGMGVSLLLSIVSGLAFGIYNLVGKLSQKFPVLQSAWNQICPPRTINFVEN